MAALGVWRSAACALASRRTARGHPAQSRQRYPL